MYIAIKRSLQIDVQYSITLSSVVTKSSLMPEINAPLNDASFRRFIVSCFFASYRVEGIKTNLENENHVKGLVFFKIFPPFHNFCVVSQHVKLQVINIKFIICIDHLID